MLYVNVSVTDDLDVLDEEINVTERNTEAILEASRETVIEIKSRRAKCMFPFHHQTAGHNYVNTAKNPTFESMQKYRCGYFSIQMQPGLLLAFPQKRSWHSSLKSVLYV
jgi:hypothetical protein